jgi:DmsE family decaheme c-type cytochrome
MNRLVVSSPCRRWWRTAAAMMPQGLMVAVALTLPSVVGHAQDRDVSAVQAQYTAEGTERCIKCHGGERMLVMAETAHGKADNPHTPYAQKGCESCHGPGSLHASRARGGIGFPALLTFGPKEPAPTRNSACLDCHASDMGDLKGMAWTDSVHDTGRISCVSCHEMHKVGNPLVQKEAQLESCSTCHRAQIKNHRRFENVGIVFDQLSCSKCHDVHQMTKTP